MALGTPSRPSWSPRRLTPLLWAGPLCLLVGLWLGCSAQRKYEVLSFFFDGVPDPNAPTSQPTAVAQGGGGAMAVRSGGQLSVHKPYKEEKCTACHSEAGRIDTVALNPDLCMTCHQKVLTAHRFVHGPVAGKACLWCHEPHESVHVALLRTTDPSLCLQCHERDALSRKTPGHSDVVRSCLDCHTGHGGEKLPFLRPAAASRPVAANLP